MRIPPLFLILLVLLVLPNRLWSQNPIGSGNWVLAGTAEVSGNHDIGNDQHTWLVQLEPRLGYFILPGLAVNAHLLGSGAWYRGGTSYQWGLGPGATYYFRLTRRFYPFVSARTLFTRTHTRVDATQSTQAAWQSSWALASGAVAMLVPHVGLSAELFYQHDHLGVEGSVSRFV